MSRYALTYPQLMNQALSCDLSDSDLLQLRKAHDFAQLFADGLYRAQGVPLLSHLVRTASILLAERQPVSVIVTGLLHAAYILHYVGGSTRQRLRHTHRARIRKAFGEEVDTLIWEYTCMAWYQPDDIREHRQRLVDYPERLRHVLIVRLANDLEDCLDLAMAYTGATRVQRRLEACVSDSIALAAQLSLHQVAEGLQACYQANCSRPLPGFLVVEHSGGYELPSRRLWQAGPAERLLLKGMCVLKALKNRF